MRIHIPLRVIDGGYPSSLGLMKLGGLLNDHGCRRCLASALSIWPMPQGDRVVQSRTRFQTHTDHHFFDIGRWNIVHKLFGQNRTGSSNGPIPAEYLHKLYRPDPHPFVYPELELGRRERTQLEKTCRDGQRSLQHGSRTGCQW